MSQKSKWIVSPILLACFMLPANCAHAEKKSKTSASSAAKKSSSKKESKRKQAPTDPYFQSDYLKKLYRRQAKRMKTIDKFKKHGWVGEADSGLLKYKDISGVGKHKELLEKVVEAENKDRSSLIRVIEAGVRDNKENKVFIRRRLFELYREMDPTGTYFYQADHWSQK